MLVENYRATVMERAGLGYAALAGENPRLIYAQLSGFGPDGPYRDKGGLDLIAQGMGGLMHVTGEPDGPPTSVGQPICDLGTGMWGVQGILAALYERGRTGRGQKVDCSLLETALGFSGWTGAAWLVDGQEPRRQGARHRQNAPYQRFATADGYLMVGAATQDLWERFARALGRAEWIEDPRFGTERGPPPAPRGAGKGGRGGAGHAVHGGLGGPARRRGCRPARSARTLSCSPIPRCVTSGWWSTRTTPSWAGCLTCGRRCACRGAGRGPDRRAPPRRAHGRGPGALGYGPAELEALRRDRVI